MASCPRCGAVTDPRVLALATTLRPPVAAWAGQAQPGWSPSHGLCPTCAAYFAHRVASRRRADSLHTTTEPPTTFPYYHPAEETVLSQPERLPDYASFDGAGVTIAFLDSGYYPHPDLMVEAAWPDLPHLSRMDDQALAAAIAARPMRLIHYVDLTNQGCREGLDTPSLWDDAGDSWHGQMTTAVAAGNGLLSGGRWRGYAPGASLLPIKIGRGRIPEEDILAGLKWLLEDDRWQRYGVRVLNVSVGGDFDEPWRENPVCLAAEELSRRGVLIAAAAGNRGWAQLLAPAQAPATLTVGGVDDGNRRWSPLNPEDVARLGLYSHNYGVVENGRAVVAKPEALALGKWLPSPVLPPSPVFAEMEAIAHLRERLMAGGAGLDELAAHWVRALHDDPVYRRQHPGGADAWRAEMWQALRKRMNARKWIHAHYQHVDGTSVAVAQVSALAAQMFQANPSLTAAQVKAIILSTALELPHLPPERTGAGLIQPARAVAAALRAAGGPLTGLPMSGAAPDHAPETPVTGVSGGGAVYFGLWAPDAQAVSVVGEFNGWAPDATPLARTRGGWWHGRVRLPPGRHPYRFWVQGGLAGESVWLADPENPARAESGYVDDHAVVAVG